MEPLIASLLRPEAYPHPTGPIELRETHSAWVLLSGPFAYKLRKPVNFGFLDFSTPERRRFFAAEELRLNRRLAPDLYLDLVEVQGPPERAQLGGEEPGIEVAVRMRQFDEDKLLSRVASHGPLAETALDGLAGELARFHSQAAVAPVDGPYGTPAAVRQPVDDNLKVLAGVSELAEPLTVALAELQCWLAAEAARLEPFFSDRLRDGHIRECHGDLHLGNLWLEEGRIRVFDCLEFNPGLRWIDTISELAFLVMDLQVRDQEEGALRVLNGWLDLCGDWQGLRGWRWYSVYRALVRAKVAELRRRQSASAEPAAQARQGEAAAERDRYLQRALLWCRPRPRALVLTHGVSGSGKSWLSERLAPRLGALRLRSDVERKRLFGLWGEPRCASLSGDPYRAEVSELLFSHTLPAQAEAMLAGGWPALVDATFLRRSDRQPFLALAERLGVPLLILALACPPQLARARIAERRQLGRDPSDADLAVLARQLQIIEPLSSSERAAASVVEVGPDADPAALACQLTPLLHA
jgi:aminoglycoside phosphotransferase family enzyme/predicted kinase